MGTSTDFSPILFIERGSYVSIPTYLTNIRLNRILIGDAINQFTYDDVKNVYFFLRNKMLDTINNKNYFSLNKSMKIKQSNFVKKTLNSINILQKRDNFIFSKSFQIGDPDTFDFDTFNMLVPNSPITNVHVDLNKLTKILLALFRTYRRIEKQMDNFIKANTELETNKVNENIIENDRKHFEKILFKFLKTKNKNIKSLKDYNDSIEMGLEDLFTLRKNTQKKILETFDESVLEKAKTYYVTYFASNVINSITNIDDIKKLEADITKKQILIDDFTTKLKSEIEKNNNLNITDGQIREENLNLKFEIAKVSEENARLKEKNSEIAKETKMLNNVNTSLKEFYNIEKEQKLQMEKKLSQVMNNNAQLEIANRNLPQEIESLNGLYNIEKEKKRELEDSLATIMDKNKSLEIINRNLMQEIKEKTSQFEKTNALLNESTSEMFKAADKKRNLEIIISDLTQEIANLNNDITSLRERFEIEKLKKLELEDLFGDVKDSNKNLQVENRNLMLEITKLNNTNSLLTERCEIEKQRRIQSESTLQDTQQNQKAAIDAENLILKQEKNNLILELEKIDKLLSDEKIKFEFLDRNSAINIKTLEEELKLQTGKINDSNTLIDDLKKHYNQKIEAKDEYIEQLNKNIESLTKMSNDWILLKQTNEIEIDRLNDTKEKSNKIINELEDTIAKYKTLYKKTNDDNILLTNDIKTFKTNMEIIQNDLDVLRKQKDLIEKHNILFTNAFQRYGIPIPSENDIATFTDNEIKDLEIDPSILNLHKNDTEIFLPFSGKITKYYDEKILDDLIKYNSTNNNITKYKTTDINLPSLKAFIQILGIYFENLLNKYSKLSRQKNKYEEDNIRLIENVKLSTEHINNVNEKNAEFNDIIFKYKITFKSKLDEYLGIIKNWIEILTTYVDQDALTPDFQANLNKLNTEEFQLTDSASQIKTDSQYITELEKYFVTLNSISDQLYAKYYDNCNVQDL